MPAFSVTHLIAAALSATVLVPTAVATRPVPVCCAVGLVYGKAPTAELTWPMAPEQPRVRYLGSLSSEADLGKPKGGFSLLRSMITGAQTSIMSVQRPYAAYVDAKQRMYVSDGARRAVVLFDPGTGKSELIGKSGPGRLAKPMASPATQMAICTSPTRAGGVSLPSHPMDHSFAPTGERTCCSIQWAWPSIARRESSM